MQAYLFGCQKGLFFFSSRRRHTRWTGDWSSDVCSSDLQVGGHQRRRDRGRRRPQPGHLLLSQDEGQKTKDGNGRSEERRVGKECRSRGWPSHSQKKKINARRYGKRVKQGMGAEGR